MEKPFSQDPEYLSGAPRFPETRVHIKTLFDYLAAGDSIEEFLTDFPGVTREQVETVLSYVAVSFGLLPANDAPHTP